MSVLSDGLSPIKPRPPRSGYAASSARGWVREPWEKELLEKIACRGEMRAEELEKRFRERLQLRITEEHAKLDHMKKKSEEIGTFLREEDFWSDDDGRGTTRKTKALNPMEQLQALKHRFALLDSVSSPAQLDRTPSQTTPTVEEHHFMMLRTLRQSLTLFYEAVCPENIGKVDELLQIFVSRGCSQKAYHDLNYELRIAFGRDLAGTAEEEPVNLYSTLPPEEIPPSRVARPGPATAPDNPAYQRWDPTATASSAGTRNSSPQQPLRSSDLHSGWHPSATPAHPQAHPAQDSVHQSPAHAPSRRPADPSAGASDSGNARPGPHSSQLELERPLVAQAQATPSHNPPLQAPTVHAPLRAAGHDRTGQPPSTPEHTPMPPNPRPVPVNSTAWHGPGPVPGAGAAPGEVGPPSPRWSGNAKLTVRAKWRYEPANKDELRFAAGDVIHVRGESDDVPVHWYWGSCNGRKGLVPGNYVEVLQRHSQPRPFVVLAPPVPPRPAMGLAQASAPIRLLPSVQSTPAPSPPQMRVPVHMVMPPGPAGGMPPGAFFVNPPMASMPAARMAHTMVQQPPPYVECMKVSF